MSFSRLPKRARLLSTFVLLMSSFHLVNTATAQDAGQDIDVDGTTSQQKEDVTTIESVAQFQEAGKSLGTLGTTIHLGDLNAGEMYQLNLKLLNQTDVPMVMKSTKSNCSCVTSQFPAGVLEPDGNCVGQIKFRVPEESTSGEFHGRLEFFDAPSARPTGALNFKGKIKGSLRIEGSMHVFELQNEIGEWHIPISYTPPITHRSLKISNASGMDAAQFELVESESKSFIRVSASKKLIPLDGVVGTIEVQDTQTNKNRSVGVSLYHEPPIKLSPHSLRFIRRANENRYSAFAMLQVSESQVRTPPKGEDKKSPTLAALISGVHLTINNNPVNVTAERIGSSNVIKLTARCSEQFLRDEFDKPDSTDESNDVGLEKVKPTAIWNIQTAKSSFEIKGGVHVVFSGE